MFEGQLSKNVIQDSAWGRVCSKNVFLGVYFLFDVILLLFWFNCCVLVLSASSCLHCLHWAAAHSVKAPLDQIRVNANELYRSEILVNVEVFNLTVIQLWIVMHECRSRYLGSCFIVMLCSYSVWSYVLFTIILYNIGVCNHKHVIWAVAFQQMGVLDVWKHWTKHCHHVDHLAVIWSFSIDFISYHMIVLSTLLS